MQQHPALRVSSPSGPLSPPSPAGPLASVPCLHPHHPGARQRPHGESAPFPRGWGPSGTNSAMIQGRVWRWALWAPRRFSPTAVCPEDVEMEAQARRHLGAWVTRRFLSHLACKRRPQGAGRLLPWASPAAFLWTLWAALEPVPVRSVHY